MNKSNQNRILELKAQLRVDEDLIAIQARSAAFRLRDLADRIERAASEGGAAVDRLFGNDNFSANHADHDKNQLYVTMWQLTDARRQYAFTEHCLENEDLEEEERAAAAIHAGLKGED